MADNDVDSTSSDVNSNRAPFGPKAHMYNIFNGFGYAINLTASYLGGVAGWFGGATNAELSAKYQTLVTPSASLFGYIWALIFFSQGLFAGAQFLPRLRDHPLVQEGVSYGYFLVCAAQAAWAILFGYELLIAALVAILVLLAGLLSILSKSWDVVDSEYKKASRARTEYEDRDLWAPSPRLSYWLLRFPFGIHAGWMAVATIVMVNVVIVSREMGHNIELWASVLGISLLFGMCMGLLLRQDEGAPVYIFPGTVAIASLGIMWELDAPSQSILDRHEESSISLMRNVSGFTGVCIIVALISRSIALLIRDKVFTRKDSRDDDDDDDGVGYIEASRGHV